MANKTKISVNERPWTVDAAPESPLLYVLSNELQLKGPRFGCGCSTAPQWPVGESRLPPSQVRPEFQAHQMSPQAPKQRYSSHRNGHIQRNCGKLSRRTDQIAQEQVDQGTRRGE